MMRVKCWVMLVAALLSAGPLWAASGATSDLGRLSRSFEQLAQRVGPAVVQIEVSGYQASETSAGVVVMRQGRGSGVLVSADGHIVTNAHVLEGARRVWVLLAGLVEGLPEPRSILKPRGVRLEARVLGIDPETDLALLDVEGAGLSHLQFGDSDSLRPGQLVLAFGSPLGLENSVSMGVVSATARQLRPEDPMIYIQTDAAVNPGNSGGALVDAEGRLVGINTLILTQSGGSEGLGFAAPSNIVRSIYRQLAEQGRVRRGEIGLGTQTITPQLAQGLSLPQQWGVVVADVHPGGAAERAGLRVGDVVLELDGKLMENARQLEVNLYRYGVDQVALLSVLRGEERLSLPVTVEERESELEQQVFELEQDEVLLPELGIYALDLDPQLAAVLPRLRSEAGVVVAARAPLGPPEAGLLRSGDLILSLNRRRVTDLAALRQVLGEVEAGDPMVLQVERHGRLGFVVIERW